MRSKITLLGFKKREVGRTILRLFELRERDRTLIGKITRICYMDGNNCGPHSKCPKGEGKRCSLKLA